MFYELKYTNDLGQTIQFGDSYKVIELEGFGEVQADIQTQKAPYQDGSRFLDSVLSERYPFIRFVMVAEEYSELVAMRRHVGNVFNPKVGGVLSLIHNGDEYWIKCWSEHVPNFPDDGTDAVGRVQTVNVDLVAPDPYWKSSKITEEPAFEPKFHFPFSGPFIMGIQRNERLIFNDGDSPAPFFIDFYGPAESPIIENLTTGEFIRINKPLIEGETFRINTADSSVYYVDEEGKETNVFNWIDLESTFFKLQLGNNDITCHCAISNNQKDFDIYYHKLYNAV